jgi:serine/threonine protein kinase
LPRGTMRGAALASLVADHGMGKLHRLDAMADDLVIGGQLGHYLIESVIGRGGMSVVYRAKHARLGTSVALKVLAPELSADDTFRERFLREAQMAAGIDHPNVIPIHDMGLHDGSLYIIMRYVHGGDLEGMLATSGTLAPAQALAMLRPVGLALDAAHEHALVHRDVKPGNILLQRSSGGEVEHVYLTDFGIAKSFDASDGLTRPGGVLGTVQYMAPEQTHGQEVSAATDVYALAGVFYHCVTGRVPFERELLDGTWPPPVDAAPTPASRLVPGLPHELDRVLARGLSPKPAERYSTCAEFLDACGAALARAPSIADEGAPSPLAENAERAGATMALEGETSAGGAEPDREAAHSGAGDAWPPPPPPPAGPAVGSPSGPPGARGGGSKRRIYAGGLAVVLAAAIVGVLLATSSSKKEKGTPSKATLGQVPTNHVTGSGTASLRLDGNVAKVTLTTNGLDYNEELAHALHIHAGGKGECPPASAARSHAGHLTISTTDGIKFYGPPAEALTTRGDTSPKSILVFSRYPTGGKIRYERTITLPASLAKRVRENNAVIVVHGVDYDHTGIYSGVLERSELNHATPATATAPALCGSLKQSKTTTASGPHRSSSVYMAALRENVDTLFACEAGQAPAASPVRRRGGSGRA